VQSEEKSSEYSTEASQKLKLAAENWDMPVIVTTNVQFFESLYASKSSRCRKLHHLANSVIIVDEAQMIPTEHFKLCINALVEIATNYHATVVICTATPPNLQQVLPRGVEPVEIINHPEDLYLSLKRVKVNFLGELSDDELSSRIIEEKQVLTIVNSKKHARILFDKIKEMNGVFHLSTRMCAAHRTEVLDTIKSRLKGLKNHTDNFSCRVISTQLIEAGVDVDFPAVYRSMAGLDSIAQAAGRCNREGKAKMGMVNVFWPEKHGMPQGWLSRTAEIGGNILEKEVDPLKVKEVKEYFSQLYQFQNLDKLGLLDEIKEMERVIKFPFRSIAEKFKLIDDFTRTVVIPWDKHCKTVLQEVENSFTPAKYTRKIQKYGVNVFEKEFKDLRQRMSPPTRGRGSVS